MYLVFSAEYLAKKSPEVGAPNPSLPWFFFLGGGGECKENQQKDMDFCIPTEPLKSLEEKGKRSKKNKEFHAGRKSKEFQKKARKGPKKMR